MSDKKYLHTQIEIAATPSQVWVVLTDFEGWKEWNPFIIKSEGKAVEGTRLKNTMLNDGKEMVFKPKVLKAKPNEELIWKGHLFVPGIFDGRHGFKLEGLPNGSTLFTNYEHFSGIFSGMILSKIRAQTETNFKAMNEALKKRVEGNK